MSSVSATASSSSLRTEPVIRRIHIGDVEATAKSLQSEPARPGPPATGPGVSYNHLRTARYRSPLDFVPLNLFAQFAGKVTNCYFLFIAVLQCIPAVSLTKGSPSGAPALVFVILVSMVKDALADYEKHRHDREENERPTTRLGACGMREWAVAWQELRVGDVVKVRNRELIPADVLLLQTSDADGVAYVMTANLDGETNLKPRQVPADLVPKGDGARPLGAGVGVLGKHGRPAPEGRKTRIAHRPKGVARLLPWLDSEGSTCQYM